MPDNKNKAANQNEFEINTPQKRSDDIKTNGNSEQDQDKQNQKPNTEKQQVGFVTDQRKNKGTTERKLDEQERKERKNPEHPTYQDTANQNKEWPQEKLNEANNEKQGSGREGTWVDEKGGIDDKASKGVGKEAYVSDEGKQKGELGDTRKDSVSERPKTETYERKDEEEKRRKENAA